MSVATFTALKEEGVKYVIVKLTQGTTYTNPYAKSQIANAQAAGLTVYVYDYVTFTSVSSAQAEADYFAEVAEEYGLDTTTLMIADVEDSSVKNSNVVTYLNAYWEELSSLGYTNHAVYTSYSFDQTYDVSSTVGKSRTWIAAYYYSYWKSTIEGSGYGAWQYTDEYDNTYDGSIDMGLFSSNTTTSSTTTTTTSSTENGEVYSDGYWYLYEGGVMQTAFMELSDGRIVYYDASGHMLYGSQEIDGAYYYFDTSIG